MERRDEKELFRVSDLYIAAYLRCNGFALWGVDHHDGGRCVFVFTPRPSAELLAQFTEETATVNVAQFSRELRSLKRKLFESA